MRFNRINNSREFDKPISLKNSVNRKTVNGKSVGEKYGFNLAFAIWLGFIAFIIIMFLLIWVFQIVMLSKIYERMKISDIKKATNTMVNIYGEEDFQLRYKNIALNNDMCVLLYNLYGQTLYSDETILGKSCAIHSLNPTFSQSELFAMVDESQNGYFYTKIENERTNTDLLLYGIKIDNVGYLFINSPLAPVAATTNILVRQLFIITNILILIGCIISMIAATTISKPINRITSMASKLANGDYSVRFNSKAYYEAQELAETLNYATAQIAKVDTQQRDLIANVSHDLRTPLTMLKAYAEMIRDLSGENPVKRNEHLNIIIEETDRLALLVSDMLDLSKLENGGLELNYTEFPISQTLREIVEHYSGLESGLNISFEADEEATVYCDESKIKQVIYNLINNAINYTGDDKCVYVKQINQEDGVRIEVRDTGSGISKDDLDLIFDKYYRSENHKRTTVGTGLGLSIVKAILKKHKYPYGVISTLDVGTTFWFFISRQNSNE